MELLMASAAAGDSINLTAAYLDNAAVVPASSSAYLCTCLIGLPRWAMRSSTNWLVLKSPYASSLPPQLAHSILLLILKRVPKQAVLTFLLGTRATLAKCWAASKGTHSPNLFIAQQMFSRASSSLSYCVVAISEQRSFTSLSFSSLVVKMLYRQIFEKSQIALVLTIRGSPGLSIRANSGSMIWLSTSIRLYLTEFAEMFASTYTTFSRSKRFVTLSIGTSLSSRS